MVQDSRPPGDADFGSESGALRPGNAVLWKENLEGTEA